MICIRRHFLHIAGAALVPPAASRICNGQPPISRRARCLWKESSFGLSQKSTSIVSATPRVRVPGQAFRRCGDCRSRTTDIARARA